MRVHLTLKSHNVKTGSIPVSTTSSDTCPASCPLRDSKTCYAKGGPLAIHWGKLDRGETGMDWSAFCDTIATLPPGTLWRHNQAGDLPGHDQYIDYEMLEALVSSNAGRRGFTYTHKPVLGADYSHNRLAVQYANAAGFTVNLSATTLSHADHLASLNIGPTVTLLPADHTAPTFRTPAGRPGIVCPVVTGKAKDCATCGLCAIATRKVIIGFPAHGAAKKRASAIAAN